MLNFLKTLFVSEKPFELKNPPAPIPGQSTQDNGPSLTGKIFEIISNIVIIYCLHWAVFLFLVLLKIEAGFFMFEWIPLEIGKVIYLVFFPVVAIFVLFVDIFSKKWSELTSWRKFRLISIVLILIVLAYGGYVGTQFHGGSGSWFGTLNEHSNVLSFLRSIRGVLMVRYI